MTDRETDSAPDSDAGAGPDLAAVVADADVLAADLLVGGAARDALDVVRAHSWLTLVVSDPLLDDAEAIVAAVVDADPDLAGDWRARVEARGTRVEHSPRDHPALACAHQGAAAHLLTFDEELRSAQTNASVKRFVEVSVSPPDGFARLFDPESVYREAVGGEYPGPDRDPRE
jgi:predicted nucleic acid-binding protein